jgi:hypothetical protein
VLARREWNRGMKFNTFSICLLLAAGLFMPIACFSSDAGCVRAHGERVTRGPEPLTNQLRVAAKAAGVEFFADGQFSVEKFTYIGKITVKSGKSWYAALLGTEWGEACRYTPRLLIFSMNREYLWQYSHFNPKPTKIAGNAIYFDSDPKSGNVIRFTMEGPPKKVLLDGDIVTLYKN